MYFLMAFWYVMSGIGVASIILFAMLLLNIFDEKLIVENFGYRIYFIILGSYALLAAPMAATINGGTSGDFIYILGCVCPGFFIVYNRLINDYQSQRAQIIPAQMPVTAQVEPEPTAPALDQPSYIPAPATLATDFDVPPQR